MSARPTALDLFCGAAGGWSLGLHRAGIRTIAACEVDRWRRAVFARNFPDVRMYDDIKTLTGERLRADGIVPDIVVGSPPCQDASTANTKGKGIDGERTGLFLDFIRIVREIQPRWAAAENVPGLRTRGADRVLAGMEEAGYAGWPCVVGAVHAGAPHLRKRVWFLWLRNDLAAAATMLRASITRREPDGDRAGVVAPDAHEDGQLAGALHGEVAELPHDTSDLAAYADQDAIRIEPRRAGGESGAGEAEFVQSAADAACDQGQPGRMGLDERRRGFSREVGSPRLKSILSESKWNGGAPDLGRVDDGISEAMASRRGLGRGCLAAYGDAVVPHITEAIGRAVLTVDATLWSRKAA